MRNRTWSRSASRLLTLALTAGFLAAQLAQAQSPVPRPAKSFTFKDPAGKTYDLAAYKGKVVFVQFLMTTCPHCQAMSQMLTKVQSELGPKGFQALGVASFADNSPQQTAKYQSTYATGFPVGFSDRDPVMNYLGLSVMQRVGVPQVVVIDKKGVIRAQTDVSGGGQLGNEAYVRQLVTQLLAEGGSSSASKAKTSSATAPRKSSKSGKAEVD